MVLLFMCLFIEKIYSICYQIDDLSSRYEKLLLMNHNKIKSIIERLCR
nr:ST22 [Edwardsiella sp. EA181011]